MEVEQCCCIAPADLGHHLRRDSLLVVVVVVVVATHDLHYTAGLQLRSHGEVLAVEEAAGRFEDNDLVEPVAGEHGYHGRI